MALLMFFLAFGVSGITSASADYKGKEAWGYINVRQDAYMFWWLYYTDVTDNYSKYPLVVWLQGGPGASSTGYGNFLEIGPLDSRLKPRNDTWIKKANLLFLDNPVGSGFSYVTNTSALAKNNSQIAADLLVTLSSLLQNIPEFQKSPLFIFGESYGGKMAVDFAITLQQAIQKKKIVCNFQGIAMGDSWISPFDSVATWSSYLYTMSLITSTEKDQLSQQVNILKKALADKNFKNATALFQVIEDMIGEFTYNVDFYNILKIPEANVPQNKSNSKITNYRLFQRHVARLYGDALDNLMNGPIREKLHIIPKNVTWGGQSAQVFDALTEDFMKPVVDSVEYLLNETKIDVTVYSGQLDLIVDTVGTTNWVEKMKWPGTKQFINSKKLPMCSAKSPCGFSKQFKNFNFYWILRAGHMVPSDASGAALTMLDAILSKKR